MKKIILVLLSVLCTGVAFGQAKKAAQQKIAVYVAADSADREMGEFVGAYLVDAITHNSSYSAIERTTEFLKALNKEHEYQHSGMVTDEQIARLGKQFGTKQVCVVKIGKLADRQFVQARLLEVETSEVKNSTKPFMFTLYDLEDVCTQVTVQLLTEKKGERTIQSVFGQ